MSKFWIQVQWCCTVILMVDLLLKDLKLHLVHISVPVYIHVIYSLQNPSQHFYWYGWLLTEPFCILCQAIFESQNLKEQIQLSEKYPCCTNRSCIFFQQTLKAQCIIAWMHTHTFFFFFCWCISWNWCKRLLK